MHCRSGRRSVPPSSQFSIGRGLLWLWRRLVLMPEESRRCGNLLLKHLLRCLRRAPLPKNASSPLACDEALRTDSALPQWRLLVHRHDPLLQEVLGHNPFRGGGVGIGTCGLRGYRRCLCDALHLRSPVLQMFWADLVMPTE
mmetsp:Transcript_5136/g.14378  ORF Transcript_5136/g.14378 Transcript_5136/m.14378 type:complete len:142 (+) Transcript_5136:1659-2084(+)